MHPPRPPVSPWSRVLLVALMLLGCTPLAGQSGVLQSRMGSLVQALQGDRHRVEDYFPRRGAWTWILTTRYASGRTTVERRLFSGSETLAAMEHPGPLCETFARGGDMASVENLMHHLRVNPLPWRLVDGRRFVPPGASPRSATFVEWRREDGRWVVSAVGEERTGGPRLLGRPRNAVVLDSVAAEPAVLPLASGGMYAARTPWYEEHQPIVYGDVWLGKYGVPRQLASGELTRIGTVNGVGVYAETGEQRFQGVVYVPVDALGSFHAYQFMTSSGCP
jgi:hypothetical protein